MKKTIIFRLAMFLIVAVMFTMYSSTKSNESAIILTSKTSSTAGSNIEIQYCQGVKFYVLVDSHGEPVSFIKF